MKQQMRSLLLHLHLSGKCHDAATATSFASKRCPNAKDGDSL